jgi:hypothetical protein
LGGGWGERLGFELKAFCLQNKYFTAWATLPAGFALVILEMASCRLFAWAGLETMILFTLARTTGLSHRYPGCFLHFNYEFHYLIDIISDY